MDDVRSIIAIHCASASRSPSIRQRRASQAASREYVLLNYGSVQQLCIGHAHAVDPSGRPAFTLSLRRCRPLHASVRGAAIACCCCYGWTHGRRRSMGGIVSYERENPTLTFIRAMPPMNRHHSVVYPSSFAPLYYTELLCSAACHMLTCIVPQPACLPSTV